MRTLQAHLSSSTGREEWGGANWALYENLGTNLVLYKNTEIEGGAPLLVTEAKETLKECINLIIQLPKPVIFNLFSLKHFPGYPLTKKAIEAGHVTEEEVGDWPEQIKSTTENSLS